MAGEPVKNYVIGVDIGGTNCRAAVVDHAQGKIVARSLNIPSRAMDGVLYTAQQVVEATTQALENANLTLDSVAGVGVAVPGHVNAAEGKILWAPNFYGQWRGVYLAKPIADTLGVAVHLGNDASLAALGEYMYGVGKGTSHFVMITLGTGVGGGVIIDGKLLLGATGGAGELGHMIVAASDSARGGNSSFGTLEGLAQRDAICERAARKLAHGPDSILLVDGYDRLKLTPQLISDAAQKGDLVAIETFNETGYYIGLGVASVINIFNPEMVVIGGGIAQAGDLLFGPLIRTAQANAIGTMYSTCKIVPADLGDNAGIMGAAALAITESTFGDRPKTSS
jgi:glucokinase